ncbi:hypothetical protein MNBD_GAMMA11-1246 [hydrothermal vent metagenome]|uniref:PEP-CTERM protein-sorting domain-containing protein n=1 Tax=hydrothermal vent metagenome TaxID=652676 RepID=A0A3B0XPH5_9ZZZZ
MNLRIIIAGLTLALFQQTSQAIPVVYFDFDGDGLQDTSVTAVSGSTLTASLYVANVDDLEGGLLGWGSEINFNNTLLSANSYSIDNQWFLQGNNNINNAGSSVELFASRLGAGLTGTLKLADISFDTLGAGSSLLTMNELFADNAAFIGFGGANTPSYNYDAEIIFSSANTTVNITAVPLPPAIVLFLSGLFGLVGIKKFKPEKLS